MRVIAFIGIVITILLLAGCEQEKTSYRNIPMVTADFGEGPWQLVTYKDQKIMFEAVVLDENRTVTRSESVYINNKSQLVFRDGKPIKNYRGEYLYWNKEGRFINKDLRIIREDILFVVNGRPMIPNTPIKIRDYTSPHLAEQMQNEGNSHGGN